MDQAFNTATIRKEGLPSLDLFLGKHRAEEWCPQQGQLLRQKSDGLQTFQQHDADALGVMVLKKIAERVFDEK